MNLKQRQSIDKLEKKNKQTLTLITNFLLLNVCIFKILSWLSNCCLAADWDRLECFLPILKSNIDSISLKYSLGFLVVLWLLLFVNSINSNLLLYFFFYKLFKMKLTFIIIKLKIYLSNLELLVCIGIKAINFAGYLFINKIF